MTMKGKLIVLEGIDGAGTTTQSNYLHKALSEEGVAVYSAKMPSDSPVGALTRRFFKDPSMTLPGFGRAMLFATDFIQQMEKEIIPALESGVNVILDRFTPYSAMAYQTFETEPYLIADLYQLIFYSCPFVVVDPDVTFMLDCPVEVAKERRLARSKDVDYYDDESFQEYARRIYKLTAVQTTGNFRLIDASKDFEIVSQEILSIAKEIINGSSVVSSPSSTGSPQE